MIGVIGCPFVGKETFLDKIADLATNLNKVVQEKPESKKSATVEESESDEDMEEGGEMEMDEEMEEESEEESEDSNEIIIGNGFSVIKFAANTLKKEQDESSLILTSALRASGL